MAAPELEVSCVTGLPARTAKRSCRLFLSKRDRATGDFVPSRFPPQPPGRSSFNLVNDPSIYP
jgi:hypothetical protein